MEHAELELLLSDTFHGGEVTCRELRLSDEDANFLSEHYPVTVRPMGHEWYQVSFPAVHTKGV